MHHQKIRILNIELDNLTLTELLESFDQGLLVTPNVDHLVKLQKDREFYECYKSAQYTVCDSRIIFLVSKLFFPMKSIRSQITGSDFFPEFCRYHSQRESDVRIFLLGGSDSSVKKAAENVNRRNNNTIICGFYSPPFGFEHSPEESDKIVELIKKSGANTLAVGVGAPKQEKWIVKHRSRLPDVSRFLAVGATIEFESGNLKRAPKFLTKWGMEWLFRLTQEPKRLIKRYIFDDIPFFFLILKQRAGLYRNPWE